MIFGITAWIFWLIVAGIFLFIEVVTTMLVTVWFMGAAVLASVSAALGATVPVQIIVFAVFSVLFFGIGWKNRSRLMMQKHKTPTNADRIIGAEGILEEAVHHVSGAGRVLVGGQNWRAATADATDLPAGTRVRITEIRGTRAIVEPLNTDEPL